ncbi:MAG: ATP-binding protein [Bacteroidia bacterium]|nr:ATP-binding protein [Bacteroidia bacterium]
MLFNKTEFALSDIESLISNNAEEGIHLEFKDAKAFFKGQSEKKDCKHEIGKDVSAFANSDGGILIYGLTEDNNRQASAISYIDSSIYSKDWLQQVIESNIERPIPDIFIHIIQNPKNPTEQIYVVKIPESANAPHMAMDKKFHRRNNQGNVVMEEYEVRRLYNQTGRTNLEIIEPTVISYGPTINSNNRITDLLFELHLEVQNIGNSIEHHYKLEIHISGIIVYSHYGQPILINKDLQRESNGFKIFSVGNTKPVFQNETNKVASIPLKISNHSLSSLESDMLLKLYYTNGIKEKSISLKELLTYNSQPITIDTFR